ncbi:monovalent cation:proton antiporter-2 (CPA2) family protein [Pollutibacter soli]|uniref:monovalent cation:proton antiporter-2 (CPA2) family protein n=1 Tax=Pollutibacter soli TaxID=3034157 RepID=UPI003013A470
MNSDFLIQALGYLAAAVVFVPIAKKLGMGSVLGYLIAGIIIGPYVTGFIGQQGDDIMHFAEFGVVMMLFLVGLELEPELLWRMRSSILGMGGLQVLITAAVVALLSLPFHMHWKEGLALGLIIAMSSTAIVLQTLNEKGLMRASAGQSAFAVLLFQDIAVIPILAVLPLLAVHSVAATGADAEKHTWISGLPGWLRTISVIGAVVGVVLAGRYIINPLLRIVARTRLREIFTATALLLVVAITVFMEKVGLSPALGTFVAGVVLANSEYKHELESDIDPFKGLLLGLFFMAVGASVNFNMVASKPILIVSLVMSIILIKALILFMLGRVYKLGMDQNLLFATALSQVGEFAFVLLSFSSEGNILSKEVIEIMMAVVAISMALTPFLLLFNEKWLTPKLGCKIEEKVEEEVTVINEKNKVIIAGFGHFGSTIGRFLRANGVTPTLLEIDSDQVELLRKMGFNVYYGDATRADLLKSAGADEASILIVAIGNPEKVLEVVETAKKHFPHLQLLVRAKNRMDAYELMDAGMMHIYRETIDTSLRLGQDALKMLGFRAYRTKRAASIFLKHDEKSLKTLAATRDDLGQYITTARERMEEQEKIIQTDLEDMGLNRDEAWDSESLREEAANVER